jgi:MYXO-CTERM domain-containing protein
VKNGVPVGDPVDVTSDPFVYETIVNAPAQGEDRYRAEVLFEGAPLTVTSHIWLKLDPNGPQAEDAAPDSGGCAVTASDPTSPLLASIVIAGLALLRARRRRR